MTTPEQMDVRQEDRMKLTPEYLAMTPLQKWETLALNGLLGTDEPWIEDMRRSLLAIQATEARMAAAAQVPSITTVNQSGGIVAGSIGNVTMSDGQPVVMNFEDAQCWNGKTAKKGAVFVPPIKGKCPKGFFYMPAEKVSSVFPRGFTYIYSEPQKDPR